MLTQIKSNFGVDTREDSTMTLVFNFCFWLFLFCFFCFRYGYRGRDCRNNLHVLSSGEIIYFIAAVVVIYDEERHRQRHYTQHTDDIKR